MDVPDRKMRNKLDQTGIYIQQPISIVSEKSAFSHLPTPSLGRDAIFLLLRAKSKELTLFPLRPTLLGGIPLFLGFRNFQENW